MIRTTIAKSAGILGRVSVTSAATAAASSTIINRSAIIRSPFVSRQWAAVGGVAAAAAGMGNTNFGGIRFYSDGPAPLTNEFVFERIAGILNGFDKVCFCYCAPGLFDFFGVLVFGLVFWVGKCEVFYWMEMDGLF